MIMMNRKVNIDQAKIDLVIYKLNSSNSISNKY